jgi:hypothetical protein
VIDVIPTREEASLAGPVAVAVGAVAVGVAIDSIARLIGNTTFAERLWLYAHPVTTLKIRDCTQQAFFQEKVFFGENSEDDEGDAFRHCYWSALLTRDIGQDYSGFFTSLHEERDDNPEDRKTMDLHNNGVGRWAFFPIKTDIGIARRCLKFLADGKLLVIASDPSKLAYARNSSDAHEGSY